MELNVESIPIIKNIIKNQKKFNYDSLPNISHFVDICDLYQITPLEFYCRKKNKSKIIEILDTKKFLIFEFDDYHPFLTCCEKSMFDICIKMANMNILPKLLDNVLDSLPYCLNSNMESIFVNLIENIDMHTINPIYVKQNRINPMHYAIKHNLKLIINKLFDYYDIFDYDEEINLNIFAIACINNDLKLINKIIEFKKDKINISIKNFKPILCLLFFKNEDLIIRLYNIINDEDKKKLYKYLFENPHYLIAHKLDKLDKFVQEIKH